MIQKMSRTDGFENNEYHSYQATIDYMEINNKAVCFNSGIDNNNDLLVKFAVLWGMKIGSTSAPKEVEAAKKMKSWDSMELAELLSAWEKEYLSQDEVEDAVNFFHIKLAKLLQE